jgi:hypothetical protein
LMEEFKCMMPRRPPNSLHGMSQGRRIILLYIITCPAADITFGSAS